MAANPMTVAVTGSTGHVGVNLIRALLEEGHRVKAMVFPGTSLPPGLDVELCEGDVLDPEGLRKAFGGAELVYHLAGVITLKARRDDLAQRVNVDGARNVAEACKETGVRRLVHFSSVHAFSAFPRDGVVDETRPLCEEPDAMAYDRSKADGHREILAAVEEGLDAVVVHPTGVIGPYDYEPSLMGKTLLDIHTRSLPAVVNGGFNWVDVRDVVQGAMAAARVGRTGENYLLGGHYVTVPGLAQLVSEITGVKAPPMALPIWFVRLVVPFVALGAFLTKTAPRFTTASMHALQNHQQVCHDKAARELDYAPRPIRETLRDTYDWFKTEGYL